MKTFNIKATVEELTYNELSSTELNLVNLARNATYKSYAPYSHFHVGAAIQLSNGEIITGANQENAAYPSGMCAERTACYYAGAKYPDAKFEAIAIAARNFDGKFTEGICSPCGACRQALLQYEILAGKGIKILLVGSEKIYRMGSIRSLLPLAFAEL